MWHTRWLPSHAAPTVDGQSWSPPYLNKELASLSFVRNRNLVECMAGYVVPGGGAVPETFWHFMIKRCNIFSLRFFPPLNGVSLYVPCWVRFSSPAVLSVVLCYLEMCFSAAIGTCLVPGQVPRCKGSCSVCVVGLLLLLLLGLLTSNLFSLSFQLPLVYQGPIEEWDNKNHWSPGKQAWAAPLCSKGMGCCQHKTSSEAEFAKTWLARCPGAWCWGVMYVWNPGLVSAGDAAGAECLNLEPILEAPWWCSSMSLVGWYGASSSIGGSSAASHLRAAEPALDNLWWHRHCSSFSLCECASPSCIPAFCRLL